MKKVLALLLAVGLAGCGDFVDEEGNTSIRQVAQGLQSLGDRVSELGEAIQRDADVQAVPWEDLMETIPQEIDGAARREAEGDQSTDRNGAGMSIAHAEFRIDGEKMFMGVADLGALRSGAGLALRWVAPLFNRGDIDGDVEEIEVEGYPAIRIVDDEDGDVFIALMAEGRFAVIAGVEGRGNEELIRRALAMIDYDQLDDWVDYGKH